MIWEFFSWKVPVAKKLRPPAGLVAADSRVKEVRLETRICVEGLGEGG